MISAADTSRVRNYRGHQGNVIVVSAPAGVNAGEVQIEASGGVFAQVFDGTEVLISVVSLPWYYRDTFVINP